MNAIRFENVSKRFGTKVLANDNVSFNIEKGEIISILGENGSGKTTLMNVVAGIYTQDAGNVYVNDQLVQIHSPKDAFALGIGMVHQHFKLVDVFTAIENIVLGLTNKDYKELSKNIVEERDELFSELYEKGEKPSKELIKKYNKLIKENSKFNLKLTTKKVEEMCHKYGFVLDLNKKVYQMSVSEKQTLEIVKVLYRGVDTLILDEPTAVLTPQEIKHLFGVLRNMKKDGKTIVIITHKLNEVLEISDRVTLLRKGQYIGTVLTKETNESQLTEMMVGHKVDLNIRRSEPINSALRLQVNELNSNDIGGRKALKNVNFEVRSGEVLGIAGISGSGQKELLEAIAGLQKGYKGDIFYTDPIDGSVIDLRKLNATQIRHLGIRLSFVPEDRLGMGLVKDMDLVDNVMLRSYYEGKSIHFSRKKPTETTKRIVDELDVKTPNIHTQVGKLSGGNIQKVLVGREISTAPTLLMVAYPVRGLDINSSYMIYELINEQKEKGVAVIFVGEDLDVLLAISDRLMVLAGGTITGIVDPRTVSKEEVGLLMTKYSESEEE